MSFINTLTKNWWKILIILFLVALLICIYITNQIGAKIDKEIYKQEFSGVVIKKYRYRGDMVVYVDLKSHLQNEIYATSELSDNVKINDTITKLPNSNQCIIKRKNIQIKVECYNIDFSSTINP